MKTPVSKGSNETNTERHYQRASNHNLQGACQPQAALKGIIKEHQITTFSGNGTDSPKLKGIIKEHQITTRMSAYVSLGY